MQPAGWAAVREAAGRDVLAADLRCSLFASALQSYKRDSVLRPFPASYARPDCKDFEALVSVLLSTPSRAVLCVPGHVACGPGLVNTPAPRLNIPSRALRKVSMNSQHPYPNIDNPKALGGYSLMLMTSNSQE